MTKKKFLFLVVCIFCSLSIFAYQNTYGQTSDEVQTFLLLRKASSTATPDPTYPVSAEQLSILVKSLDYSNLSGSYRDMYNNLVEKLENPEVIFSRNNVGVDQQVDILGFQLMVSKDPNTYTILPYKDRLPFANFQTDLYLTDNFFGRFNINVSPLYADFQEGGALNKAKNMYLYTVLNFMRFSDGYPDHSFASVGYKNFNITVGRDRLVAGNGYTGNLELGGNLNYEDFVKASFISDFISYDFTYEGFNHSSGSDRDISLDAMKKNFFIHRISFNIADVANISAYEGAMIYGNGSSLDARLLNPFMFIHGLYSFWDAKTNNFAGLETVINLPKGFQIDGQLFIDQICSKKIIGEDPLDSGETALMGLVNISNTREVGNGILDLYAEGVYGNPYVYLKSTHSYGVSDDNIEDYINFGHKNVDLVFDKKSDDDRPNSKDNQYMGYKYGGDLASVAIGGSYAFDKYKVKLDLQYLNKGTFGIRDGEKRLCEERDETKVSEKTLMANAGFDCTVFKGVDISAKAAALCHFNYHHVEAAPVWDFQCSLGVNIHVLDFFDIRKPL